MPEHLDCAETARVTDESSSKQPAEQAGGQVNAAPAGAASDQRLTFKQQYLKDLSFENPNAPAVYGELQNGPEVAVQLDMTAHRLQSRTFEIMLKVKAHASTEGRTAFLIEVDYGAVVTVGASVPKREVGWLVSVEAPRLLFPFARAIVAEATRDGGFPPLLINPVDFESLYQQRQRGDGTAETEGATDPAAVPE
jgi:preprotein translocase subunit SecB